MSSGNAAHQLAYSTTVISAESDAVGATSVLSLQAAKVNRMNDSATKVKRLGNSALFINEFLLFLKLKPLAEFLHFMFI